MRGGDPARYCDGTPSSDSEPSPRRCRRPVRNARRSAGRAFATGAFKETGCRRGAELPVNTIVVVFLNPCLRRLVELRQGNGIDAS